MHAKARKQALKTLENSISMMPLNPQSFTAQARDKFFERARGHFVKEMDVVYLLRQIRFLNFAAKTLLTEQ